MGKKVLVFDDGSTMHMDFNKKIKKIKKEMTYLLDSPLIPEELKNAIRLGLSKNK